MPIPKHALYLSSSTREPSTIREALQGLESPDFAKLCQLTPKGIKAIGMWLDGAEESRVAPTAASELSLKHAAALGKLFNQKSVLVWHGEPGPDSRHIYRGLALSKRPEEVQKMLASAGVGEFHSQDENGDVHVINSPAEKPVAVNGITPETSSGQSILIGHDDRQTAQQVYDHVLRFGRMPQ